MEQAPYPIVLLGALLLACSPGAGTARAGEPEADWFAKIFTGLGLTRDSDLRIRQSIGNDLVFHDVAWDDDSIGGRSAPYGGGRVGRFFRGKPWLGLAIDFVHYKVFAEHDREVRVRGVHLGQPIDTLQPMSAIVERYQIANGVNLLSFNVLGRLRLRREPAWPGGRMQPYAGIGVGPTWLYTESSIDGLDRNGPYEWGRVGGQIIGGVQLGLGRRFDLFTEYRLSYTEAEGTVDAGSSRAELWTHHFVVGAGYHF